MLVSPHYTPGHPSCRHALVCLTGALPAKTEAQLHSVLGHMQQGGLTLAADTVAAWSFWWCQPSLFLSKMQHVRKMSAPPHAQSPHSSCLLANRPSASADQRNDVSSAHSLLVFSWGCLLRVLGKSQAFPRCRIPSAFGRLQLPC